MAIINISNTTVNRVDEVEKTVESLHSQIITQLNLQNELNTDLTNSINNLKEQLYNQYLINDDILKVIKQLNEYNLKQDKKIRRLTILLSIVATIAVVGIALIFFL